jgi:molybdopterin converting factor small subunit
MSSLAPESMTTNQEQAGTGQTVKLEYYSWLAKELVGAGEEGTTVEVPLAGDGTVRSLLAGLAADSEAFRRLVYDAEERRLREYASLILNGRVIELAGGLDAPLKPGDHLLLLPGFSGG